MSREAIGDDTLAKVVAECAAKETEERKPAKSAEKVNKQSKIGKEEDNTTGNRATRRASKNWNEHALDVIMQRAWIIMYIALGYKTIAGETQGLENL